MMNDKMYQNGIEAIRVGVTLYKKSFTEKKNLYRTKNHDRNTVLISTWHVCWTKYIDGCQNLYQDPQKLYLWINTMPFMNQKLEYKEF